MQTLQRKRLQALEEKIKIKVKKLKRGGDGIFLL